MVLRCGISTEMQDKLAKFRAALVLMLAVMFAPGGAPAADEDVGVETELIAEVRETVRVGEGETVRFVPAKVLSQGQVVYYTVRILNRSPVYAERVTVTQRIPANTSYVAGSASGPAAKVTFSVDGGQTYSESDAPPHLDAGDQGAKAPVREFTHIRWELAHPLAPGAVALARFQATFQ
jgi:uncharacterized repeat protein (TIGR01451 family)